MRVGVSCPRHLIGVGSIDRDRGKARAAGDASYFPPVLWRKHTGGIRFVFEYAHRRPTIAAPGSAPPPAVQRERIETSDSQQRALKRKTELAKPTARH
jgi:hypothetical protein